MTEIMQLRCIHCGKPVDETTKDHVFPTSWYPETTPEDTRRWTAPSCGECNNSLGSMEKKVLSRLILCVDPQKPEAAGLYAKLKRSLGVGVDDLSKEEAAHRQKQKLGLIAAIKRHDPASNASILPGLGSHTGFRDENLPQIRIPGDLLLKVYEKIVRGCEYVLAGRIVEEPTPNRLTTRGAAQKDVVDIGYSLVLSLLSFSRMNASISEALARMRSHCSL
jgi:hypothetical protein